jgi:hypothetical protein
MMIVDYIAIERHVRLGLTLGLSSLLIDVHSLNLGVTNYTIDAMMVDAYGAI